MTPGWYFQLEGDEFDLKTMREAFGGVLDVREGKLCIRVEATDARAAQDSAHRKANLLNAAAHVAFDNHVSVKLSAGFHETADGKPATQIISPTSIRSHRRVGGSGQLAAAVFATAVNNTDFQRAVWIFGVVPHDWRGLYVVLEVIVDGCKGLKQIADAKLIEEAKLFKYTAGNYETIGELARHGPEPRTPPTNPPTLEDAKTLIRTLLERWARKTAAAD